MLLGRERERHGIEGVLARARCGESDALVLVGEPGIGKSALLGFASEQAGGMQVLQARGIESEARIPFASLLEVLRPALGRLDALPEPQAAALGAALALRPTGAHERFAVGAATLSLLAAYAEECPVLVLIDDAHWLDAPSAEALVFALRRMVVDPVCAVLARREDMPSPLSDAGLSTMHVGGLGVDEARELLPELPDVVLRGLHAATGGNPLAMLELRGEPDPMALALEGVPVPLPDRLSRAYSRRLAGLPEESRRALGFLAAGDAADLAALERGARRSGIDLEALRAGARAGLVSLSGGRATFCHPLIRSAAYASLSPDEQRRIHLALAATLPDRDADRRAWHLAAGVVGSDEDASVALEQAARRSLDRTAYATSSLAFERAARLTAAPQRRAELLLGAAQAAWHAGLGERTGLLLGEARQAGDGDAVVLGIDDLEGRMATAGQGTVMRGYEILVEAAQRAEPAQAVGMLAEASAAAFYAGDAARMLIAATQALERLPAVASTRVRFLALAAQGMAQVFGGDAAQGAASIRRAVELATDSPDLADEPQLLPWIVVTVLFLRENEAGRDILDMAVARARERAALDGLTFMLNLLGRDQATTDRWKEAEASYLEAAALARDTGQHTQLAMALAGLTWLYARLGRETTMRAAADEALAIGRRLGTRLLDAWVLAGLADLALGRGRLPEALEHLEHRQRLLEELGISDPDLSPGPELVEVMTRLGREAEATGLAEDAWSQALAKGQPWSLARAARARGLVASEDEMAREFERAIGLHLQTADQFELARTRLAFAERLRRARARREARPLLRAALGVFERLEAEPWAERARSELAASGETLLRRDASSLDELTPQELQIALLLASGATTRQAAAALFISPKTVEYHLRHVYLKLGVHSRDQLAEAMSPHAAPSPGPEDLVSPAG